jgi:hypothetical protein
VDTPGVWVRTRLTTFPVPKMICPDCRNVLEPHLVDTGFLLPVWLMRCALEGTYWEHRSIA